MIPIPGIKTIAAIIVAVALAAGGWWAYNAGKRSVQADWDAERHELARLVRQHQDANRETARAAEIRYVDRETVRTEYLTTTKEELRNESQNLESCRLDAGDISLLNKAAGTARQD